MQHARPPGVLVLDDEPAIRILLEQALTEAGFHVWTAGTGAEAVNVFAANSAVIDVALLDIRLPDMAGPRVMAALRCVAPGVCCCFMSGSLLPGEPEPLLPAGAQHVFAKPFDPYEAARVLWQLLASRRQERA